VISYGTRVYIAVRLVVNCYSRLLYFMTTSALFVEFGFGIFDVPMSPHNSVKTSVRRL